MYKEEIYDFIQELSNQIIDVNSFEKKMTSCLSWKKFFIYSGYPEIVLYLTQSKDLIENINFIDALKYYIKQFKKNIQHSQLYLNNNAGILSGYCGIGYMLLELDKIGVKVDKILNSLNEKIYIVLKRKLKRVRKHLEDGKVCYEDYDSLDGLSSSLRYLIEFKEKDEFRLLINDIVNYFISLTTNNKDNYPNYYIKTDRLDELRKIRNPHGIIDYGMAHGMSGVLSSLSLVKIAGLEVNGIEECIKNLLHKIGKTVKHINGINYWPGIVKIDDYLNNTINEYNINDYGWCYGVAGTARAIFLGGQACGELEYINLAKETFNQISLNIEKIDLTTYIICHGYSGLLVILNEMYIDTSSKLLQKAADVIASKTLKWLKSIDILSEMDRLESKGECSIDIWEGIIGIALALISYEDNKKNIISKLMLVR